MFSLQKLLGKEDKFFTLLEASAEEARGSVQALVKLSKDLDQPVALDEFSYARRKDKQITKEISTAVYTTFITALEREDIEELSNALYKIPKTVEKFTERVLMSPQHVRGIDFSKQISLLAGIQLPLQEKCFDISEALPQSRGHAAVLRQVQHNRSSAVLGPIERQVQRGVRGSIVHHNHHVDLRKYRVEHGNQRRFLVVNRQ